MAIRTAVILSTYNQPAHLLRVLAGYSVQSRRCVVVIADDGSGAETRGVIERARADWGMDIKHVWHEDVGFRKCTILNRAIVAADAEYLIFSDGDCVPRRDFVETHVALAREGCFLSGGYLLMPKGVSEALSADHVREGKATDLRFLQSIGLDPTMRLRSRLVEQGLAAKLLDALTTTRPTWNGHNSSCWKSDAVRVNGFDERMEWGGEDREFGMRLVHAGLKAVQIRFRTPLVHLHHERGYVREEKVKLNAQIREETKRRRLIATEHGILQTSAT
ncbi:MAG: glycosyltransferase [Phycisphaerales bacterium]